MKSAVGTLLTTIATIALCLLTSCVTLSQSPDPAEVQARIAAAREQEIELVRATVADPGRAERFIALLREREGLVEAHAERLAAHRKRIAALAADYDARREDFEAVLAEFNRQRAAAQQETIDLVAAMKEATTADEWAIISKFQLKRLEPRKLVYGAVGQGG
jgi:flagellar motility protein MotE (MotC chaperone)